MIRLILINSGVFFGLLALAEGGLRLVFDPDVDPGGVAGFAYRSYYASHVRPMVQYLPDCARYDDRLSYRLRPGRCRFSGREFDTWITMNSAGFRDDESSLDAPEIIILGDSHTMGWGVEDHQTFPSLLESRLGRRVLNAGVTSYGTAREMMVLEELDTRRLKTLVIQYSHNDLRENETRVVEGYLPIMPRERYQYLVDKHPRTISDYPGKLLLKWFPRLAKYALDPDQDERAGDDRREAELFWQIFQTGPVPKGVRVVILEINGYALNDDGFIRALRETQPPGRAVQFLDLSTVLDTDHYFQVDDHINADGHQAVADVLASALATPSQP